MKNKFLLSVCIALLVCSVSEVYSKTNLERQLWKNANLGWDVNQTNDYYSNNFHIGTGISDRFDADNHAFWQIGVDLNWSKYVLYADGNYSYFNRNSLLRTQSLTFPIVLGYDLRQSFFSGMNIYTGPVYEMVLSANLDGRPNYDLKPGQWGWTVGTKIRFLGFLSAKIAYNYYSTGLFWNGDMNRSALSLSIGL
jgi:hypothetical protein